MSTAQASKSATQDQAYRPRGRTLLHQIVDRHYGQFVCQYEQKYRETYGDYRFERIDRAMGQFRECGD